MVWYQSKWKCYFVRTDPLTPTSSVLGSDVTNNPEPSKRLSSPSHTEVSFISPTQSPLSAVTTSWRRGRCQEGRGLTGEHKRDGQTERVTSSINETLAKWWEKLVPLIIWCNRRSTRFKFWDVCLQKVSAVKAALLVLGIFRWSLTSSATQGLM